MSFSLTRTIKLASVMYFDEQENPLDYQYPYNEQKMKHWMQHNDVQGFFLSLPDSALIPSFDELSKNFPTYLEAESKRMMNTISHITSHLSTGSSDADLLSSITLEKEMHKKLNSWSKNQFMNITSPTQLG